MIELPELIATFLILSFCIGATVPLLRGSPLDEQRILVLALVMHLAFGLFVKYATGNVFSEGDVWAYRDFSTPLVALAREDPFHYIPQLFRALLRMSNDFGFAGADPTENMVPATALGRLVSFDSFYALYALVGWLSFLSKWMIYATFRDELKTLDKRYIALAAMCIPSVVFWSSGVIKEAYAFVGFGPLFYGVREVVKARRLARGILSVLFGAWVVAAFKPYLLFPFGVGASLWLVFEHSKKARENAVVYLAMGTFIGYAAVLALGTIFPQFSPTELTQQTASLQHFGATTEGGSNYTINQTDRSLTGQLAHAPLALLTTMARPAPWEAHNFTSAVAAFEMSVLTFLLGRGLLKGKSSAVRTTFSQPITLFAVVLFLLGATAIGLATTNFGTLSRYRAPIMPFYGVIVVVLTLSVEAERKRQLKLRAATSHREMGLPEKALARARARALLRRQ